MRLVPDNPRAPEDGDLCGGEGRPGHGCYRCCPACNLVAHYCPGCGENLNHGVDVCLRCRNRKDLT